ncbi:Crp/Fnr family transcriptional regulator [Bosea sp. RCC_152_1]|uniref:Crp/Fnr family transcriptional regulator n=1 Tax=Bosea sp. RCC_152_1 TaxID=3239228 RepID=UPI003524A5C3
MQIGQLKSLSGYIELLRTSHVGVNHVTTEEKALLSSAQFRHLGFARGKEIVAAKSRPGESCLMIKGISGRETVTPDGKRQISALHIAGDFVDLHSFVLKQMDHAVIALTDVRVAFISHSELRRIIDLSPHLGRLFWLLTTIDGARVLEKIPAGRQCET